MSCSQISTDILNNCDNYLSAGTDDTMILLPYDDIDRTLSTLDVTNKHLLTNLVMKSTKKGCKVEGRYFSNDADYALVKTKYSNDWDHNIMFRIFDISPATKEWIAQLGSGRVVALLKTKTTAINAQHQYEVYGWDLGLELGEMTRNQSDAETKGANVLKLVCDETNKEPKQPLTFFKTDVPTTEAAVAALITVTP